MLSVRRSSPKHEAAAWACSAGLPPAAACLSSSSDSDVSPLHSNDELFGWMPRQIFKLAAARDLPSEMGHEANALPGHEQIEFVSWAVGQPNLHCKAATQDEASTRLSNQRWNPLPSMQTANRWGWESTTGRCRGWGPRPARDCAPRSAGTGL